MIANPKTTTDKTLKIRIKLQPAEASAVSLDTPKKLYTKETVNSNIDNKNKRGNKNWILAIAGVITILVATFLFLSKESKKVTPTELSQYKPTVSGPNHTDNNQLEIDTAVTNNKADITDSSIANVQNDSETQVTNTLNKDGSEGLLYNTNDEKSVSTNSDFIENQILLESLDSIPPEEKAANLSSNNKRPESSLSTPTEEITNSSHSDPDLASLNNQAKLKEQLSSSATDLESISSQPSLPPNISRAQFTNGVYNREPVDQVGIRAFSNNKPSKRLFYFTELRNLKGEKITHKWVYDNNTMAKVSFNIGGNRWRVYSSKNLSSSMKGKWKVVIADSSNKVLLTDSIIYE